MVYPSQLLCYVFIRAHTRLRVRVFRIHIYFFRQVNLIILHTLYD